MRRTLSTIIVISAVIGLALKVLLVSRPSGQAGTLGQPGAADGAKPASSRRPDRRFHRYQSPNYTRGKRIADDGTFSARGCTSAHKTKVKSRNQYEKTINSFNCKRAHQNTPIHTYRLLCTDMYRLLLSI